MEKIHYSGQPFHNQHKLQSAPYNTKKILYSLNLQIFLSLNKSVTTLFASIFIISILFSINAFAANSSIPDWIKNNAKWWSDGLIEESDYISSLQYLVNQGIIHIPTSINEVIASDVNLNNDDRAKSFVVHFSGGDYLDSELTIYTFSKFLHFSDAIGGSSVSPTSQFSDTPQFTLQSLPSKDKKKFYELINQYIDAGRAPEPFDVKVDILSGDSTLIQSWDYRKCDIVDYATFLNEDKETYRFSDTDEAEIRDIAVFSCRGFSLLT